MVDKAKHGRVFWRAARVLMGALQFAATLDTMTNQGVVSQADIPALRPILPTTSQTMSTPSRPGASQFIPFSVPTTHLQPNQTPNVSTQELYTLTKSLDTSLSNSPRLSSVRALLGVARANYAQASVLPNPGIYLANNYGNSYLLGASIPVEPPWKLYFRLVVAKRQLEQTKLDILRQLWLFRGEVRRNYVQLVMAEEMLRARRELMELANKICDASKTQYDAGNAPGLDVHRAKLAYIQAKMDCEQAEIQVAQTKEQMNLIMGRKPEAPVSVPSLPGVKTAPNSELLPDFNHNFPNREELVATALKNRMELKVAQQAISVNEANLKNAVGNIIPTPRFVTGKVVERNPPTGPTTTNAFFQAYIDAPVFNLQQGDIARFKAMRAQLKLDRESQENQISGQVSLAYHRVLAARQRLKTFQEEALPESESVAKISAHGYEIGQLDLNTLLDSQRANIQTKSQYFDAVLAYQLAFNDLEQAIGVPLQ
jgi:cobalt-zinc-cadmium efflux system outer membrane protein